MDIAAVITAHREGAIAGVSLRSLLSAVENARAAGLEVEILVLLDDPDPSTEALFADAETHGWTVETVHLKDQGLARNRAVELSTADYIAFLDGDDLWSDNWLVESHRLCTEDPGRIIAHPDVNWFFESNSNLFFHIDQTDPRFDPNFLRFGNYWDALCLAPRAACENHPFAERAVADGWAYEDWHWNLDTVAAGFVHRVARGTIHFKRRRAASQTIEASTNKCLTRPSVVHDYRWAAAHAAGAPEAALD